MNYLALAYVAGGGALGSVGRYLLTNIINTIMGPGTFPYAIFIVNITGSFFMGLCVGFMAALAPERAKEMHLLFAVGVLGGYTTFSTFSLDAYMLIEQGLYMQAALYMLGSVLLSVAGLAGGLAIMRMAIQ
ncbi:MAG: fluoride efflux transporter CrcB [Alphaproteobacteria bacterium]|nr:fluoride efflux transporter CrcB [Alphaproteobacteria bacterium]